MSREKVNVGGNFVHSEPQEGEPKFPAHWLLEVKDPSAHTTIYLVGLIYYFLYEQRNTETDFFSSKFHCFTVYFVTLSFIYTNVCTCF